MEVSGIYWIRNIVNNKIYIGSSSNCRLRFNLHRSKLNRRIHENKHLQNSWNKYGIDNFEFQILITCDKSLLLFYEQQFIDLWNPEYNINVLASKPNKRVYTEEQKLKVSREHKGKIVPENVRNKISISHMGVKKSQESIDKMMRARENNWIIFADSLDNLPHNLEFVYSITSPQGEKYTIVNLSRFCKEYKINSLGHMNEVVHGKRNSYKGWKGEILCQR